MDANIETTKARIAALKGELDRVRNEWLSGLKQFASQWVLTTAKREFGEARTRITVDPSSASEAKKEIEKLSQELLPGLVDEIAAAQRWWPHLDAKLPVRNVYDKGGPEDGARHVLWHVYPLLAKYGLADPKVVKEGAQQGNRYPYFVEFPQGMQDRLQYYFRSYDDLRISTDALSYMKKEQRQREAEAEWDTL